MVRREVRPKSERMPQNELESAVAGDGMTNGVTAAASSASPRAALIRSWFEFMVSSWP